MKSLKIFIDSDEVLAETINEVLKRYNAEYNLDLKREEIKDWDLKKVQKEGTDINKYFKQKGFFRDLTVKKDAAQIMKLLAVNNNIVIATVSPKEGERDKKEWFEEHFPFIKEENILLLKGSKDYLIGDIILDDAIHNLENSQCDFPIIFDQPWNRHTDKFIRVYNWLDFYQVVQKIRVGASLEEIMYERKLIKKWRDERNESKKAI